MKELSFCSEFFFWLISAPKDTIKTISRQVMILTKIDTPWGISCNSGKSILSIGLVHQDASLGLLKQI
jgi:hypothetical protein